MMHNDIDRIRDALQFIDSSDRETWLHMGMAIKSELGDTGFDLWETWSQQANSFNTTDARDVWKSIRAGGKVTLGTLFYEAKATPSHTQAIPQAASINPATMPQRVMMMATLGLIRNHWPRRSQPNPIRWMRSPRRFVLEWKKLLGSPKHRCR